MPLSRLVPLSETQEDSPSYALRAALAQRLSAHRASAREAAPGSYTHLTLPPN